MIGSTCYSASTIQSLNPTCPYSSSSSSVISSLHKPQIQNNIIQNTRRRRRRRIITCNYNRRRMTSAVGAMKTTTSEVGIQNQQELKKGIADLYDESSGIWEDIWGDHMHHGYYQPQSSVSLSDHRSAQIRYSLVWFARSGCFILYAPTG